MHKSNGFTIVELLIVIVVIAILAAITIVSYNGITARANDSAVQTGLSSTYKKVTIQNEQTGTSACHTTYQEMNIACLNSSDAFAALPKKALAQNGVDVMRYYMYGTVVTIVAKSSSGAFFIMKDGALSQITEQEYQSSNASDTCGVTATYSSISNNWTQEAHYC